MDYITAQGWLRAEEREKLVALAKQVPSNGMIVNIGVEYGASVVCLRSGNESCNIIGIDIDMTKLHETVYRWAKPLLVFGNSCDDKVRNRVSSLVSAFNTKDSAPSIDLLFIDGDHTYDGVLCDTWYCGLVAKGGVVVFHDCYDWDHPETRKPNPNAPSINDAVNHWVLDNAGLWEDLGVAGTMRIFKKV